MASDIIKNFIESYINIKESGQARIYYDDIAMSTDEEAFAWYEENNGGEEAINELIAAYYDPNSSPEDIVEEIAAFIESEYEIANGDPTLEDEDRFDQSYEDDVELFKREGTYDDLDEAISKKEEGFYHDRHYDDSAEGAIRFLLDVADLPSIKKAEAFPVENEPGNWCVFDCKNRWVAVVYLNARDFEVSDNEARILRLRRKFIESSYRQIKGAPEGVKGKKTAKGRMIKHSDDDIDDDEFAAMIADFENDPSNYEESYGVYRKGGSIGDKKSDKPVKTFDTEDEAKGYASRMNKSLSKGEKGYYGMKYTVRKMKESDNTSSVTAEDISEFLTKLFKKGVEVQNWGGNDWKTSLGMADVNDVGDISLYAPSQQFLFLGNVLSGEVEPGAVEAYKSEMKGWEDANKTGHSKTWNEGKVAYTSIKNIDPGVAAVEARLALADAGVKVAGEDKEWVGKFINAYLPKPDYLMQLVVKDVIKDYYDSFVRAKLDADRRDYIS